MSGIQKTPSSNPLKRSADATAPDPKKPRVTITPSTIAESSIGDREAYLESKPMTIIAVEKMLFSLFATSEEKATLKTFLLNLTKPGTYQCPHLVRENLGQSFIRTSLHAFIDRMIMGSIAADVKDKAIGAAHFCSHFGIPLEDARKAITIDESDKIVTTLTDSQKNIMLQEYCKILKECSSKEIKEITNSTKGSINCMYFNFYNDIESGEYDDVTELELHEYDLYLLPKNIGKLTKLTELNLYNHYLLNLPPEIGELTNLTELYLSSNKFTSLPPGIGKLTNLTKLDLEDNKLTRLPPGIGKLTSLTVLDLRNNKLTSLPPEIGKLTSLTVLDLRNNKLTSLPPEIGKLTRLTKLNLDKNKLTRFPPEIVKLTSLTKLNLDMNKLTVLSPEIGKLTNLTKLNLENNKLTSFPPEIGKLTNLTKLNLEFNKLTVLPPEIGKLTSLTELNLDKNKLTRFPPEIEKLTKLIRLYLTNNQLTMVPSGIEKLTNLTQLDLNNNPDLKKTLTGIKDLTFFGASYIQTFFKELKDYHDLKDANELISSLMDL